MPPLAFWRVPSEARTEAHRNDFVRIITSGCLMGLASVGGLYEVREYCADRLEKT